jgi:cyclopropane fatty-acyl-phospholipid synthase-like methyltransferase
MSDYPYERMTAFVLEKLRGLAEEKKWFDEKNLKLIDEKRGFADEKRFDDGNLKFIDEKRGLAEEKRLDDRNLSARLKGFEFACGTGRMTLPLAAAGCEMTATDISADMLNIACEKAKREGLKIAFLKVDVNAPALLGKYDFVVCMTDGFNYVGSLSRLDGLFGLVFGALREGGLLIFDMSSAYKAENILSEKLYFDDGEELSFFWRNSKYSKKSRKIRMELTFFEKKEGNYIRFDEENLQFFYENDDIETLLKKNGFETEFFDEKLSGLKKHSKRIVAVAKKGKKRKI